MLLDMSILMKRKLYVPYGLSVCVATLFIKKPQRTSYIFFNKIARRFWGRSVLFLFICSKSPVHLLAKPYKLVEI